MYECLFAIGGHFEFYVFCKMPQLVFTATFIMLLMLLCHNSNNCKIKGLQGFIQFGIFISVFNKKSSHLSTYCANKTK